MKKILILLFPLLVISITKAESFLENIHAKAELSTLTIKSLDDEIELDWALEIGNVNQEKYEYLIRYEHNYDKQTDIYAKTTVKETSTVVEQTFDINNIFNILGFASHINLSSSKENHIYLQKHNFELAPIGIKLDFYKSKLISDLSLSYLPTYNYLEHNNSDSSSSPSYIIERSLLHLIKLKFALNYNDFNLKHEMRWKEIKPFDDTIKDQRDFIFTTKTKLGYSINSYFEISYAYSINVDKRRKEVQHLPSTDRRHDITISLGLN